jgi:hypothetical protein
VADVVAARRLAAGGGGAAGVHKRLALAAAQLAAQLAQLLAVLEQRVVQPHQLLRARKAVLVLEVVGVVGVVGVGVWRGDSGWVEVRRAGGRVGGG